MTTLCFHLEMTDDNEFVWWIDSPDAPGFYATASTIGECRERALEALASEGLDITEVREMLVDAEELTASERPSVALNVDDQETATARDERTVIRTLQLIA